MRWKLTITGAARKQWTRWDWFWCAKQLFSDVLPFVLRLSRRCGVSVSAFGMTNWHYCSSAHMWSVTANIYSGRVTIGFWYIDGARWSHSLSARKRQLQFAHTKQQVPTTIRATMSEKIIKKTTQDDAMLCGGKTDGRTMMAPLDGRIV